MITGVWINPTDPDEEDCLIIEYTYEHQGERMLLDGNGDMMPMEGHAPSTWTRIFPVTGLNQHITGTVTGTAVQLGNVEGGISIGDV